MGRHALARIVRALAGGGAPGRLCNGLSGLEVVFSYEAEVDSTGSVDRSAAMAGAPANRAIAAVAAASWIFIGHLERGTLRGGAQAGMAAARLPISTPQG